MSIPGIGMMTAMAMLLELQNMERFRKPEHICSICGIDTSTIFKWGKDSYGAYHWNRAKATCELLSLKHPGS